MNQQRRAKQETEARHETAMNEIGRSMREHTTRHETMAEEKAIEWRKQRTGMGRDMEQTEMESYEMASTEKTRDNGRCQTNSDRRNTD